jgi:hypothetical protein
MKRPVNLAVSALLVGLASCSTQYGCKGLPEDPACLSAVEAYQFTDKANSTVRPNDASAPVMGKPGTSTATAPGSASTLAGTDNRRANSAPAPKKDRRPHADTDTLKGHAYLGGPLGGCGRRPERVGLPVHRTRTAPLDGRQGCAVSGNQPQALASHPSGEGEKECAVQCRHGNHELNGR